MLNVLASKLLHHLIGQNHWAPEILSPFAGQSVQFNVAMVSMGLIVLEDGRLAVAGETLTPDATIHISPSVAMRLMAQDDSAKREVEITGDTHLASELAKVLRNMRWDYTDDLSRVIGDVPAQQLTQLTHNTFNTFQDAGKNMAHMLSEYWQEEQPMIAKKIHVEAFNADVDRLRADVARLEKKIKKLTATLAP